MYTTVTHLEMTSYAKNKYGEKRRTLSWLNNNNKKKAEDTLFRLTRVQRSSELELLRRISWFVKLIVI